jgi:hypothetical protein
VRRALCALLAAASLAAAAQERMPWFPLDAREAALGGRHVALADYEGVLRANPAGLAAAPPGIVFSRASARLSGPIFDVAGMAIEGGTANILSSVGSLFDADGRLFAAADVDGPVHFSVISKGFGFGAFNRTRAIVNASSLTNVRIEAIEDLYLMAGYGYGFKLGSGLGLEIGLGAKGFARAATPIDTDILGLMTLLQDVEGAMMTVPLSASSGFSLDAGLRFTAWNGRFALGVAGTDAFGMAWTGGSTSLLGFAADPLGALAGATDSILPADLSAGVLVTPKLGILGRYVTDIRVMADYADILSLLDPVPRNPVLLASAGLEVTLHDILHIRAGIGEGLFSAGFGVDLTLFNLSMAMYGRELGDEPGSRPIYNILIDMSFELF